MRQYIWTIWTKPFRDRGSQIELLHYTMLSLSVLLANSHGRAHRIYTDSTGEAFLSTLGLPVEVVVSLDSIENQPVTKWAFPKILTLKNVKEPVTHIDYDVFLWKEQASYDADLVVQNWEDSSHYTSIYSRSFKRHGMAGNFIDPAVQAQANNNRYGGFNCGYLEVKSPDKVVEWATRSEAMFAQSPRFHSDYNIIAEQYLLFAMQLAGEITVEPLLREYDGYWDAHFEAMGYTHLMLAKRSTNVLPRLLARVREKNAAVYAVLTNRFRETPTMQSMISSFASAIVNEAKAAITTPPVNVRTVEERLEICRECEFFSQASGRCSQCGCRMALKTRFRAAECPIGKWGKLTKDTNSVLTWKT